VASIAPAGPTPVLLLIDRQPMVMKPTEKLLASQPILWQ